MRQIRDMISKHSINVIWCAWFKTMVGLDIGFSIRYDEEISLRYGFYD